jgi:hypothetical protein
VVLANGVKHYQQYPKQNHIVVSAGQVSVLDKEQCGGGCCLALKKDWFWDGQNQEE